MKNFLSRRHLQILPRSIRHKIFRQQLQLPYALPEGLKFKIANTREELEQAFSLLHDAYVKAGYMDADPSGLRVTPYHCVPSTSTLIAVWDDRVVATMAVVRDGSMGVPMDSIFDLSDLRKSGERLTEISALAIHPDCRKERGFLLHAFIRYMWNYCLWYFGTDAFVIAVNPSMNDLYESVYLFERLKSKDFVGNYSFVKGAPAIGLYRNLQSSIEQFRTVYGGRSNEKNLHHYISNTLMKADSFPERSYFRISDPVMTPALLRYFLKERTHSWDKLNDHQRKGLIFSNFCLSESELFDDRGLRRLGEDFKSVPRIRKRRFDVECPVLSIGETMYPASWGIRIRDVSETGLRLLLGPGSSVSPELASRQSINALISPKTRVRLEVEPIWSRPNRLSGYRIVDAPKDWTHFIEYLHVTVGLSHGSPKEDAVPA